MQNDPLVGKVDNPSLKVILKYRNHLSILAKEGKFKSNSVFTFFHIALEDILQETCDLDTSKSSEDRYVLTKFIKENSDIFAPFICESFNNMID